MPSHKEHRNAANEQGPVDVEQRRAADVEAGHLEAHAPVVSGAGSTDICEAHDAEGTFFDCLISFVCVPLFTVTSETIVVATHCRRLHF